MEERAENRFGRRNPRLAFLTPLALVAACGSKEPPPPSLGGMSHVDYTSHDPITCHDVRDCPGPTMCGPCDERPITPQILGKECLTAICNDMHVWCSGGGVCWEKPDDVRSRTSSSVDASAPEAAPQTAPATSPRLVGVDSTGDDFSSWTLRAEGFPAVSGDGKRVCYVLSFKTDEMPSDRMLVKQTDTDRVVATYVVFDPDKLRSAGANPDAKRAEIERNLQAARAALGAEHWTPMPPAGGAGQDGVNIELYAERLRIADRAGRVLLDRDVHAWRAKDIPPDSTSALPCIREPRVASAFVDFGKQLVIVTIRHVLTSPGAASCELPDDVHAVTWR